MKTNLDSVFKVDRSLEKDGVWFAITDKTEFLVRRFTDRNPRVAAAMAKHYKPFAKQLSINSLPKAKEMEIMRNVFIEGCLIDWKGVEIDGVDTPYSRDIAHELFKHAPDLFETLLSQSQSLEHYKEESDVEEVGNS